jgi:hypothetical protein
MMPQILIVTQEQGYRINENLLICCNIAGQKDTLENHNCILNSGPGIFHRAMDLRFLQIRYFLGVGHLNLK